MAFKYNVVERKKRDKDPTYRELLSPALMDILQARIYDIIVVQRRFLDHSYSARQMAEDIGTNTRYVSAVMSVRFKMNYTSFVNSLRVKEAQRLLTDKSLAGRNVEDIGLMVGFANRQSFYCSFFRYVGIPPKAWRRQQLEGK